MGIICVECPGFFEYANLEYCIFCGGELPLVCPFRNESIEDFYTYCGFCHNDFL